MPVFSSVLYDPSNLFHGVSTKYATLCAAEAGLELDFGSGKPVRAVLVAHETDYPEVSEIATKYGVEVISIAESSIQP